MNLLHQSLKQEARSLCALRDLLKNILYIACKFVSITCYRFVLPQPRIQSSRDRMFSRLTCTWTVQEPARNNNSFNIVILLSRFNIVMQDVWLYRHVTRPDQISLTWNLFSNICCLVISYFYWVQLDIKLPHKWLHAFIV